MARCANPPIGSIISAFPRGSEVVVLLCVSRVDLHYLSCARQSRVSATALFGILTFINKGFLVYLPLSTKVSRCLKSKCSPESWSYIFGIPSSGSPNSSYSKIWHPKIWYCKFAVFEMLGLPTSSILNFSCFNLLVVQILVFLNSCLSWVF